MAPLIFMATRMLVIGWKKRALAPIAALLAALSIAGCATSSSGKRDSASMASNSGQQEASVRAAPRQAKDGRVTVTGAVNKPGIYPYRGATLLDFVTIAGGFTDKASSDRCSLATGTLGREVKRRGNSDRARTRSGHPSRGRNCGADLWI